ncbi:MAG: hypothetical protein KAR76_02980 [Methanosarcinales archaeon]|nr:hypothetical protein [Methanosarcinales archaeon]
METCPPPPEALTPLPDMLLLTWCGCNYSTDTATAARKGGMVAANLVDSCCLGLKSQE